jgi:hypothetical protein
MEVASVEDRLVDLLEADVVEAGGLEDARGDRHPSRLSADLCPWPRRDLS